MKVLAALLLAACLSYVGAITLLGIADRNAAENEARTRRITTEQTCKVLVEAKLVTSCGVK